MEPVKKIAIITGASRGIGKATVALFIKRGWQVISCSRDNNVECENEENWISHITADLADSASLEKFINKVNENLDGRPLGALVNNAGMSPKAENKERLGCLNGDIEAWREVFELNFYAPLKLGRGFAGALHKGVGAIVNVTSIAGHMIHPFAGSAYSSSKAAL